MSLLDVSQPLRDGWSWLNGLTDWSGPIAALLGAGVAAILGLWVSSRLALQTEYRQLRAAMWIVHTELRENSTRIANIEKQGGDNQKERRRDCLLLGDWIDTKLHLAALTHQKEGVGLVEDVARLYAVMSEFKSERSDDEPSRRELAELAGRLEAARTGVKKRPWRLKITYKAPSGSRARPEVDSSV